MKFARPSARAALLTSVALLPATTAGFAQVDGRLSPEFAKFFGVYERIKAELCRAGRRQDADQAARSTACSPRSIRTRTTSKAPASSG